MTVSDHCRSTLLASHCSARHAQQIHNASHTPRGQAHPADGFDGFEAHTELAPHVSKQREQWVGLYSPVSQPSLLKPPVGIASQSASPAGHVGHGYPGQGNSRLELYNPNVHYRRMLSTVHFSDHMRPYCNGKRRQSRPGAAWRTPAHPSDRRTGRSGKWPAHWGISRHKDRS